MQKLTITLVLVGILSTPCQAEEFVPRTKEQVEKLVMAIYKAEGGEKAKKPFGILSVPCQSYGECKRICANTVRNNVKRWDNSDKSVDYLTFLRNRYAPIKGKWLTKTEKSVNIYWLKNVKHFLEKGQSNEEKKQQ